MRFSTRTLLAWVLVLAVFLACAIAYVRPYQNYNRHYNTVLHQHRVSFSCEFIEFPDFLRARLPAGYYTRITELYFRLPEHNNEVLVEIVPHLEAFNELKRLDFYPESNVTDEGIAELVKLSQVKLLWLHGPNFTDGCVHNIARMKGLTILRLDGVNFTDACLEQIGQMTHLEEISFNRTIVSQNALEHLCETMPDCMISKDSIVVGLGNGPARLISD